MRVFRALAKTVLRLRPIQTARRRRLQKASERHFSTGRNAAGFACLLKLAEFNDPGALYRLGYCCERGFGTLQDFVMALRWYERAAALRVDAAMIALGDIYLTGRGPVTTPDNGFGGRPSGGRARAVAIDFGKAAHWNSMAAKAGFAAAQARLGFQYSAGAGVPADLVEARKWFTESAKQNNPSGQLGLGLLLVGKASTAEDRASGASCLEEASAQGNQAAKLALAKLLLVDDRSKTDCERGAELLLQLSAEHHTDAMFQLGEIYRLGRGIGVDLTKAEMWLRRACSRQYAPALRSLDRLLSEQISPPDFAYAAIILRQGAERGDPHCQLRLGEIYARGDGVSIDTTEAAAWLQKAGLQGYVSARAYRDRASYGYGAGIRWLEKPFGITAACAISSFPA